MFNKIGSASAFTSKVNLIHNDKFKNLYRFEKFQDALKELENNGENDTVTLIPQEIPAMMNMGYSQAYYDIQVMEERNNQKYIGVSYIPVYDLHKIVSAYNEAKEDMSPVNGGKLDKYII